MITRAQWDAMTGQQQWDQYTLLLSECGDSDEVTETTEPYIAKKYPAPSGMPMIFKTDTPGEYVFFVTP